MFKYAKPQYPTKGQGKTLAEAKKKSKPNTLGKKDPWAHLGKAKNMNCVYINGERVCDDYSDLLGKEQSIEDMYNYKEWELYHKMAANNKSKPNTLGKKDPWAHLGNGKNMNCVYVNGERLCDDYSDLLGKKQSIEDMYNYKEWNLYHKMAANKRPSTSSITRAAKGIASSINSAAYQMSSPKKRKEMDEDRKLKKLLNPGPLKFNKKQSIEDMYNYKEWELYHKMAANKLKTPSSKNNLNRATSINDNRRKAPGLNNSNGMKRMPANPSFTKNKDPKFKKPGMLNNYIKDM